MIDFDPGAWDMAYGIQIRRTPHLPPNTRLALLRSILTQPGGKEHTNFMVGSLLEYWPEDPSLEVALDYVEGHLGLLWPPFHWLESDPRKRICGASLGKRGLWFPVSHLWLGDRENVLSAMEILQEGAYCGLALPDLAYQFFMYALRGVHCAQELGCSLSHLHIRTGSLNSKRGPVSDQKWQELATWITFKGGVIRLRRVRSNWQGHQTIALLRDPQSDQPIDLDITALRAHAGRGLSRAIDQMT